MADLVTMDRPMMTLREAMDRLVAQSFTPFGNGYGEAPKPSAQANVWETAEGYHVWLLVPGVDAETIQITAQNGVLSITGGMANGLPEQAKPIYQEWSPAKFERHIRLSNDLDSEHATASYRDGVLKVYVPKAAHSRPKTIKVEAATS
jgi:HSP20 family molecular chaperone IbpA